MNLDLTTIIIASSAAILSGMGTAIIAGIHENRKEKNSKAEIEQYQLKIELKYLKIELYHLEIELTQWKDKYYNVLQDLIMVKSELENALRELTDLDLIENES
jgi:hypothetical protein